MKKGSEFIREDITKESMSLQAKSSVDDSIRAALTSEDGGILQAGVLPQVHGAAPAGAKALLNSITQAGRVTSLLH